MYLGISSSLQHGSPEEWAAKHKALGLECVNFPVTCDEDAETIMAYKQAADEAGLTIAEVGVWRNTLAADTDERKKWMDYAVRQLRMADAIGAACCVNVVGTPYGPRWDGGYRDNFSRELWDMAVAMIRQIIDTARPQHTKFCIESMPWMIPGVRHPPRRGEHDQFAPPLFLQRRVPPRVFREAPRHHRELPPEGYPAKARIHLPATGVRLWRGYAGYLSLRPTGHC